MIFIKTYKKILFCLLIFGIIGMGTTYANSDLSISKDSEEGKVKVTVTNNETGETNVYEDSLEQVVKENDLRINSIQSEDYKSVVEGYEVFIPIERLEESSSDFSILDVDGGSKTSGGVTARVYVNYDLRNGGQEIRLNTVYGSWSPSHSSYYIQNRKVNAHSGSVWGKNLARTPSSNSYRYETQWGYNRFIGGGSDGSPRAWTSAVVTNSGASGSHTISLDITFP